jgi:adenylate cyclase
MTARRLAAILAADVVGYSRLMERDEEGTLARLKELQTHVIEPRIAAHGGRLVKTIGDGFLVEFASPVEAVRASLVIQEAIGRDRGDNTDTDGLLRIGINLGDVIADENDIYGDGVNVAARLEGLAKPGGICISRSVRDQVRDRLPIKLEDLGEVSVKNLDRQVRVFAIRSDTPQQPPRSTGVRREPVEKVLPLNDKPSIIVLPFVNMSGDPEQEYFVDGMTEDITTELSRFRALHVISRNTAFVFKGRAINAREVAQSVGARYALEGSARKAGTRVRLNAQLIATDADAHLWAERFDRSLEDVFAVQEELTRIIVGSVVPEVGVAEINAVLRLRSGDMRAYELGVQAWAHAQRAYEEASANGTAEALATAEKALEIDGSCLRALHAVRLVHFTRGMYRIGDKQGAIAAGLEAVKRAHAIDPRDHMVYFGRGALRTLIPDLDGAVADLRYAHQLSPNDTHVLNLLGFVEAIAGEWKAGLGHLELALRLSPRDPQRYHFYSNMAVAARLGEQYERARDYARLSLQERPEFALGHFNLALASEALDDMGTARSSFEKLRTLAPGFAEQILSGHAPYSRAVDRERAASGLRRIVDASVT